MKLFEVAIKIRTGFSPYKKGNYILDKNTSVQFTGTTLPKDDELGKWLFADGDGKQEIEGKFKQSVKKMVASRKSAKSSSFSHSLTVKKV